MAVLFLQLCQHEHSQAKEIENDNPAHSVYELQCKTADLFADYKRIFPRQYQALVMVGLYIFGIICAIIYALILKSTKFKGEPVPFVMELPNYRLPSAKSVVHLIWEKAKGFIEKAFTIIFVASIIIWFLQTFDAKFNVAESPEQSLLAMIGSLVAPILLRSDLVIGEYQQLSLQALQQKKALCLHLLYLWAEMPSL